MEIPKQKLCECHNQPIKVETKEMGFNVPDRDTTYFKDKNGFVVQFICSVTNTPCSVVQEVTTEPTIRRKLQQILNKEKITKKDVVGYLNAIGYVKVHDLGWVLQEKLGELVMKGVVKQIDGMYILTYEGATRYNISSIFRYLDGRTNTLDIQALTKQAVTKKKEQRMVDKIFEDL